MKYLDVLLRLFSQEGYTHREDVAIIISDIFEENPDIPLDDFIKKIKKIRRNFFRINKLNRDDFAEEAFILLNRVREDYSDALDKFKIAKNFVSTHFELGFDSTTFIEERTVIMERFSEVKKPHAVLMGAFNKVLAGILLSYTVDLHGVKEYSGIDISKIVNNATIGFQIKSPNDDISEHMIRAETSKAQDWGMNGFVLIYGRKRNRTVETSIQGAYHHFRILRESKRMYCAIVYPELLAELFRVNSIAI